MKEIPLTQGKYALIDDIDLERVSQYKWFARKSKKCYYAATYIREWEKVKMIHLHHFIAGWPLNGLIVDHKDRNGLNNQISNLRICTQAQNVANRTGWGISKYLGVSKIKGRERWRAFIGFQKKIIYLGVFVSENAAALAYNEAAKKYKGEFANLNDINV